MFTRLVSLLATLALVLLTTLSAAHASGMNAQASVHARAAEMEMHATGAADGSCAERAPCGKADRAMCEVVCAGTMLFLAPGCGALAGMLEPARHDRRADAVPASHTPGSIERPPRGRFL